jgi:hypothetical protein
MRAVLITLSLAAGLALAACQPAAIVHDKAYFASHPVERAQSLAACRNDAGRLGGTPNCVNAIQADADAEHQRVFHSTPPPAPGVNNASHL